MRHVCARQILLQRAKSLDAVAFAKLNLRTRVFLHVRCQHARNSWCSPLISDIKAVSITRRKLK